jgi:hypothetical protein
MEGEEDSSTHNQVSKPCSTHSSSKFVHNNTEDTGDIHNYASHLPSIGMEGEGDSDTHDQVHTLLILSNVSNAVPNFKHPTLSEDVENRSQRN